MIAGVPAETTPGERRVALTPDAVKALVKDGIQVAVQSGAGTSAGFDDASYASAGARVTGAAGWRSRTSCRPRGRSSRRSCSTSPRTPRSG